jgi:hypothetical protein
MLHIAGWSTSRHADVPDDDRPGRVPGLADADDPLSAMVPVTIMNV